MRMHTAVAQRLRVLLQERGMSAYLLHMRTNVPKSTISDLLNGRRASVGLPLLGRLCSGLEITVAQFFASPLFEQELEL